MVLKLRAWAKGGALMVGGASPTILVLPTVVKKG
jgi:hypothetical protein